MHAAMLLLKVAAWHRMGRTPSALVYLQSVVHYFKSHLFTLFKARSW
jgi:hypothetical protein